MLAVICQPAREAGGIVPPLLDRAPDVPEPVRPKLGLDARGRVREAQLPPLVHPVHEGSLADIPYTNAHEDPTAVAISRKGRDGTWHDITCAEFASQVTAVARGLIAHGLQPGDRLAIISRPRYEWTLLDFAAWAAGLITVPVYPTSSPSQMAWILHDSGARACGVEGVEEARMVTSLRDRLPYLEHLWQFNALSREGGAIGQITSAGRQLPDSAVAERRAMLSPGTVATLIYTSGTTGAPKGCVLTHGNFFTEVDNANELLYPLFRKVSSEPASTLLFLPLAHVFGRMVAIGCLRARVRLGHAPSLATEDLLRDFAGFRPTLLFTVPLLLEKVYNTARATAEDMGRAASFDRAAKVARRYGTAREEALHAGRDAPALGIRLLRALYDVLVYRRIRAALGGKVRYVVCGGSPLGRRLAAFFEGAGVSVFEGYGLTETTAAVTTTPPQLPRMGTVGWPMPGVGIRIADDGEVLVRGGQIFNGYWDVASQQVISETDEEGWLPTGDVGTLDADGYLTITGRKKDLIITSGGKNIAPAPLEDWLRAHPLISQCVVIGDDRPYLTALITLDPDGFAHWQQIAGRGGRPMHDLVNDPELLRHVQRAVDDANRMVSTAESIRRFTVLPRDFTESTGHLTPSMKLRRSAVLRDYADEIERMYAGG
jgi:long-chain acyl-CoA synthetase